jgi:hypothetical protein
MFSIPKPGKDPALPLSTYKSASKIGKLFKNILLPMILCEVSGRGLLRDEHFWVQTQTQQCAAASPPFRKSIQEL